MPQPGESKVPEERDANELERELAELQRLLVQSMDQLAEQVLDQIQSTRQMVDATDAIRAQLRKSSPLDDDAARLTEAHMRRLSWRFNEALRDLPEYQWDNYADACVQIAKMLQRADQAADGAA